MLLSATLCVKLNLYLWENCIFKINFHLYKKPKFNLSIKYFLLWIGGFGINDASSWFRYLNAAVVVTGKSCLRQTVAPNRKRPWSSLWIIFSKPQKFFLFILTVGFILLTNWNKEYIRLTKEGLGPLFLYFFISWSCQC